MNTRKEHTEMAIRVHNFMGKLGWNVFRSFPVRAI